MAAAIAITSCKKDNDDAIVTKTITVLSDADLDGHIINSSPSVVNSTDDRLLMGWSGGIPSRSFISFDISEIAPAEDKTLVIEKVVLMVYEQNTNMSPFDGADDTSRVVEAYLVNYGSLDKTDYNKEAFANCGVITNAMGGVLHEFTLNVTEFVGDYLQQNSSSTNIQFRLQLTHDNIATEHVMNSAGWYIYSGEDQGNTYNRYRPVLDITYHLE